VEDGSEGRSGEGWGIGKKGEYGGVGKRGEEGRRSKESFIIFKRLLKFYHFHTGKSFK